MKTKLSCEASFKLQKLNVWKRSFRARLPSNSKSWRFENKAFVRGFLQIPRVEEMKTKLSCEASFKFQEVKKWPHLFSAAVPMHRVSQHMQNTIAQHHQRREKVTWNHQLHCARKTSGNESLQATTPKTVARASQLFSATEPPFTRKNTMFRANPNIQIASRHCMKMKLSSEASFKALQDLTGGSLKARAD